MYHYRDTKTISIKIILVSLLSTLIQAGKLCSSKKIFRLIRINNERVFFILTKTTKMDVWKLCYYSQTYFEVEIDALKVTWLVGSTRDAPVKKLKYIALQRNKKLPKVVVI